VVYSEQILRNAEIEVSMNQENETAVKITASMYPEQERVIRQFAEESHRTFSNALQFIVTDWATMKMAAIRDASEQPARVGGVS
jgi:hypothetical protein